jgi:RNA-directed DNA polymerase
MTTARLADLQTLDDVAQACGIESTRIVTFAETANQAALYTVLRIPKRSAKRRGSFRTVYKANSDALSGFHRSIAMVAVNSANFGEHVQGFVKKRSTRTNAARHLGARLLLHADITAFFDSISVQQVSEALVVASCAPDIAAVLARACTIDGYLRQGTRCAPALANLVCQHLDADMLALAQSAGAVYSRYADDMTFSGDDIPKPVSVEHVLKRYGFALRDGHCYQQRRGRNQYVTGLTIADKIKPRLPRRLKRNLRLALHYIEKFGFKAHAIRTGADELEMSRLSGMLDYVNSVEPELAQEWARALAAGSRKATP